MSIEIDVLNGESAWPRAKPLLDLVWPADARARSLAGGPIDWARPDLRVLLETPDGVIVSHIGLFFRTVLWKGRKHRIGGIGDVATHPDARKHGYATVALNAAVQTFRHHEALDFVLLFCLPHNAAFYEARGWHRFEGGIMAEQPDGRVRFETTTAFLPYVLDLTNAPREGVIDLCGKPW